MDSEKMNIDEGNEIKKDKKDEKKEDKKEEIKKDKKDEKKEDKKEEIKKDKKEEIKKDKKEEDEKKEDKKDEKKENKKEEIKENKKDEKKEDKKDEKKEDKKEEIKDEKTKEIKENKKEDKKDEIKEKDKKEEIKIIINNLISQLKKEPSLYPNILNYIFRSLKYSFNSIMELYHFPKFSHNELINNFTKYKNKIKDKIYSINPNNKIYILLSCIFGAFLGDSLGSYCEFSNASNKNCNNIFIGNNIFNQEPGIFTDDSEMAISFTFAIFDLPNIKNLNSNYIYFYYYYWIMSHPFDCGNTIRSAFRFIKKEYDLENINFNDFKKFISISNDNSLANGFLMRISPFIVWFYYCYNKEIEEIIKGKIKEKYNEMFNLIKNEAIKDNQLTHPNYENTLASSLFIFMSLSSIVQNKPREIINQIEYILINGEEFQQDNKKDISKDFQKKILNELKKIKDEENYDKYEYFNNVTFQFGYYLHAFRMTLHYLYYFDDYKDKNNISKYRIIMNEICNFGGDTDTNCAIVGTVIGPLIGYYNFGNNDFNYLISVDRYNRIQFSAFLIYFYVMYLEKNFDLINKGKYVTEEKPRYNTLKLFLEMLYDVKDDEE